LLHSNGGQKDHRDECTTYQKLNRHFLMLASLANGRNGPRSRPSDYATNGRVARELPFVPSLQIRLQLAPFAVIDALRLA
jgi:hypothetical protein